jgi:hypothetical protein
MTTTRRSFLASSLAGLAFSQGHRPGGHFAKFDRRAKEVVSRMSLDQKIGQMTQPDQLYLKNLDDIEKYHLGSLLNGGDSDPK